VNTVCKQLIGLYADSDELLKHARVVGLDEIEENEFNLNITRYVDTFEPEPRIKVEDALDALTKADQAALDASKELTNLLGAIGYAHTDTH
jgi:type I restriction enzyme M protein